jgi:hypothetical protein
MRSSDLHSLFGQVGIVFQPLIESVASKLPGIKYQFMEPEEFRGILHSSLQEGNRIYWTEMLYRAHWAASANILRHKRWHAACLSLSAQPANFLGFTAALRGLLEAAADGYFSLGAVPLTLAENHRNIKHALSGEAKDLAISPDLENLLIHFQYGRKIKKDETAPDPHKAKSATDYLSAADGVGNKELKTLYSELCQLVHPAAHSVLWFGEESAGTITLTNADDKEWILDLCKRHSEAISSLQMLSINPCLLIFKILNMFSVKSLWIDYVNMIDMSKVPSWLKIKKALSI